MSWIGSAPKSAIAALLLLAGCNDNAPDQTVTRSDRTPPLGEILTIDGRQTHVWDSGGRGPVVVLVHGASGNLRDFTFGMTDRLDDDYRVIAMDRPGLGFSEMLHDRGESPQEQANHLAKVLDEKGVRDAIIVGHSFGGSVAMAWALERPDQVAAVVTLAGAVMPWPGALGAWYDIASSKLGGTTVVPLLVAITPKSAANTVVPRLYEPDPVPTGYIDYIGVDLTLRTPVIRANARQINVLKPHLEVMSDRYSGLSVPVEIVHGTADTVVPADVHAKAMHARLPNSRLTLLPNIGHMPHHAEPDAAHNAIDRAAQRAGLR